MIDLNIQGEWNKKKNHLASNFAELTDDDLSYVKGQENELIKRVQKRLGINYQGARKIIYLSGHCRK